jgi:hypothetical protein
MLQALVDGQEKERAVARAMLVEQAVQARTFSQIEVQVF